MNETEYRKKIIFEHTRKISPYLCPELSIYLITDECPLWTAGETELSRLGIPDPYWGFCWAGGQALSRYILDHPHLFAGKQVIDFGTGCGVQAIAAKKAGALSVIAYDIDPWALESVRINAGANLVDIETSGENIIGNEHLESDILLAGDMFYDQS
ncbi:MAG: methyltransferase, partial [Oligoflexales bacterium]|nr:methyltransferase [Oligoflexales bacterium]